METLSQVFKLLQTHAGDICQSCFWKLLATMLQGRCLLIAGPYNGVDSNATLMMTIIKIMMAKNSVCAPASHGCATRGRSSADSNILPKLTSLQHRRLVGRETLVHWMLLYYIHQHPDWQQQYNNHLHGMHYSFYLILVSS